MRKFFLFIAFLISGVGLSAQELVERGLSWGHDVGRYNLLFSAISTSPEDPTCMLAGVNYWQSGYPPINMNIPSTSNFAGLEFRVIKIGHVGYQGVQTVSIPVGVVEIGNMAFAQTALRNIALPNSVSYIGSDAFSNCTQLSSIVIPNSVTFIGNRAFYNTKLSSVELPNSVTSVESNTFENCNSLVNITLPGSIVSIGNYAFSGCSKLPSIEIPNSVTNIGTHAFSGCTLLSSVELPNSMTSIEDYTFMDCKSLANVHIPDGVTSIENYAFYGCTSLSSIDIPDNVAYIGYAFDGCSNLKHINCYAEEVPETNIDAFNNLPNDLIIKVPSASLSMYQNAEPWKNYNLTTGLNYTIEVNVSHDDAGIIEGSGIYEEGQTITLTAMPNDGYVFVNWMENGNIVSDDIEYVFTVDKNRKLLANFVRANHWTVDESLYANNMSITAVVQIEGIEQRTTDIEIGAFCEGELRGSKLLKYEDGLDRYILYLTVYGETGDVISFRIYDHGDASELDLYYNESVTFIVNDNIGSVVNPLVFNFTSEVRHQRTLTANWNWYSTFIEVSGENGFNQMTDNLGGFAEQLKSQLAFTNYYPEMDGWFGALETVNSKEMYMIDMSESMTLNITGTMINPEEFPIVLGLNWKWISYPISQEMSVSEALSNLTPHDGDYIKSQYGFSQYYEGIGWRGSLETMTPGQGYMYQNTSGINKTLYYPTPNESKKKLKANVTTEKNHWIPKVNKYPMNMTMIAVIDDGDESGFEIGSFCDGECRGSARPIYIEELDSYLIFLTIYGEGNEKITFRYYDMYSEEEYEIATTVNFEIDFTIGNVMKPYVLNFVTMNIDERLCNFEVYPNPIDKCNVIYLGNECEKVEIYSSIGVKVSEYKNVNAIEGIDIPGVYVIKLMDKGNVNYSKIIVK